MLGTETVDGFECYKIEAIPKPDAPIIWGKVILWIDVKTHVQRKSAMYDEDDELVQTILGQNIKQMGGRNIATKMTLIPADEEGHQTIMEYQEIIFDAKVDERFFSTQNMKRVR